jgi:hypothetical protein
LKAKPGPDEVATGGSSAVKNSNHSGFGGAFGAFVLALTFASPALAQGQGIFDQLFGAPRRTNATAYADPSPQFSLFGRTADPAAPAAPVAPRAAPSPSVAYCVRLCDGRYFPIQKSNGGDAVELCSNFCPAARTKVYSGSVIEHAVDRDGKSYAKLDTAFVYRDKIVPNCSCNGRDAFGLVTPAATDDPTLRSGDIVASENGFVAYAGGSRKNAEFTPIHAGSGPGDFRQKFAAAKIEPRNATPVPPQALVDNAKPERRGRDRRAQITR